MGSIASFTCLHVDFQALTAFFPSLPPRSQAFRHKRSMTSMQLLPLFYDRENEAEGIRVISYSPTTTKQKIWMIRSMTNRDAGFQPIFCSTIYQAVFHFPCEMMYQKLCQRKSRQKRNHPHSSQVTSSFIVLPYFLLTPIGNEGMPAVFR